MAATRLDINELRALAEVNIIAKYVEGRIKTATSRGIAALLNPARLPRNRTDQPIVPSRATTAALASSGYQTPEPVPLRVGAAIPGKLKRRRGKEHSPMVLDRLIALHVLTINHNYCVPWLVQQLAGKGGGAGGDVMTPQKSDDAMNLGYRCFDKYLNMLLFCDMLAMAEQIYRDTPNCRLPFDNQNDLFLELAHTHMTSKNFRRAFAIAKDCLDLRSIFREETSWARHFLMSVFVNMLRALLHLVQYEAMAFDLRAMAGAEVAALIEPRRLIVDIFAAFASLPQYVGPELENSFAEFRTFDCDPAVTIQANHIVILDPMPSQMPSDEPIQKVKNELADAMEE